MTHKTCNTCKVSLPADSFYKRGNGLTSRCKACTKEWQRTHYAANKDSYRERNYQTKYGISVDHYDSLFASQSGKCAICGTTEPGGKGRFHVDHCHTTGEVRGLLCSHCNTALGKFQDSPEVLQSAINYLKEHHG